MRLSGEGNNIQGKGMPNQGGIVGSGRFRVDLFVGGASLCPFKNVLKFVDAHWGLEEREKGSPIAKLGFPVVRGGEARLRFYFPPVFLVGEILPYYRLPVLNFHRYGILYQLTLSVV